MGWVTRMGHTREVFCNARAKRSRSSTAWWQALHTSTIHNKIRSLVPEKRDYPRNEQNLDSEMLRLPVASILPIPSHLEMKRTVIQMGIKGLHTPGVGNWVPRSCLSLSSIPSKQWEKRMQPPEVTCRNVFASIGWTMCGKPRACFTDRGSWVFSKLSRKRCMPTPLGWAQPSGACLGWPLNCWLTLAKCFPLNLLISN